MISSNVDYSEFRGLSADTKPTAENGATFFEMDTNKTYMYDKENAQWREIEVGGGSSSELPSVTADDNGDVLTVVSGAWAKATPSGSGGSAIVTQMVDGYTDKTAGEIESAVENGGIVYFKRVSEYDGYYVYNILESLETDGSTYWTAYFANNQLVADDRDEGFQYAD